MAKYKHGMTDEELGQQVTLTARVEKEFSLTLDIGEWAEMFGVSPRTVKGWLDRRDRPTVGDDVKRELDQAEFHPYRKDFYQSETDEFEVTEFFEV